MFAVCLVVRRNHLKKKMFQFPNPRRQLERFLLWLEAAENLSHDGRSHEEIFKRSFICAQHFSSECFQLGYTTLKLQHTAIPTYYFITYYFIFV